MRKVLPKLSLFGFALLAFLWGGMVHASSFGQDLQDTPWVDESQYQACGQSCLFQKANENLTLDATYTLEKLERVKALDSEDEIFHALRGFCADGGESAEECRDRYVVAATRSLYQTRASIGTNESSAGLLQKTQGTSVRSYGRKPNLKPQVPTVISWDRMKEKVSQQRTEKRSRERWLNDVAPQPPKFEDFVVFKEIDRDPSDPSAGKFTVVDSSPKGLEKQKKAYEAALAAYKDRMKSLEATWASRAAQARWRDDAPNDVPAEDSIEKESFERARRRVIGAVNEKLEQMGMVSKQKKTTANRKTAGVESDGDASAKAPPGRTNTRVRVQSAGAAQAVPRAVPVDPRDDPGNDNVRPVETSKDRDDFVTVSWSPDQLAEQATEELRKTPPSGPPSELPLE